MRCPQRLHVFQPTKANNQAIESLVPCQLPRREQAGVPELKGTRKGGLEEIKNRLTGHPSHTTPPTSHSPRRHDQMLSRTPNTSTSLAPLSTAPHRPYPSTKLPAPQVQARMFQEGDERPGQTSLIHPPFRPTEQPPVLPQRRYRPSVLPTFRPLGSR